MENILSNSRKNDLNYFLSGIESSTKETSKEFNMLKTFFVSDWHFGDDRFDIMSRPFKSLEQMTKTIVSNHNRVVRKKDLVFVLGDIIYGGKEEYFPIISKMKGRKILIRGNHDRNWQREDLLKYFDEVYEENERVILNEYCLCHYPSLGLKECFNLVGHIHSAWRVQLNMLNVGVDVNHFCPLDFEKVKFMQKAIKEFYDDDVWVAYKESNIFYFGQRGKKGSYIDAK